MPQLSIFSALARAVYAADARATPVQVWMMLGATVAMLTAWIGVAISALRRGYPGRRSRCYLRRRSIPTPNDTFHSPAPDPGAPALNRFGVSVLVM